MSMNVEQELVALKEEVAGLRAEVGRLKAREAELRPFLGVTKPETGRPYLHITCWGIELVEPDKPDQMQAHFFASKEGPYLSLWGSDSTARLTMKVKEDIAELNLFAKDVKQAVMLRVVEPEGRGQVAVLEQGSPRAVMQAAPGGNGAVSVVHEDGVPRACLSSSDTEGGTLLVITPDNKVGVKLGGNGPRGTGYLAVNHGNGKPAVVLAATEEHGCVLLNRRDGELHMTLPLSGPPKED